MNEPNDRQFAPRLIAEAHTRLSSPLYAITLVLVGLACLLPGDFNRRGLGRRLLLAAAAGLAVEALSIAIPNLAARIPAAIPFLYAAPLALIAVCAAALTAGRIRQRRPAASAAAAEPAGGD
jgi:lipopolysaccharide export system permease protein